MKSRCYLDLPGIQNEAGRRYFVVPRLIFGEKRGIDKVPGKKFHSPFVFVCFLFLFYPLSTKKILDRFLYFLYTILMIGKKVSILRNHNEVTTK